MKARKHNDYIVGGVYKSIRVSLDTDKTVDPLDIRKLLCTMSSFPIIRLRKVGDDIVHESFLILIGRL